MKLLHVLANGDPGGGATVVLALTRGLLEKGHELYVVTQQDSYVLKQARQCGAHSHGLGFFRSRLDVTVPRKLGRIIANISPDIVHVHGARTGFFTSFTPKRARPCPLVYTVHGYRFLNKPSPARQLAVLAERRAHASADVSIHISRYDENLATAWGLLAQGHRCALIPNGIDPADIPSAKNTRLKSVGVLARLDYAKNPLFAVEVARLLAPEGYTFKLIGGGELEPEVRELIRRYGLEESVTITGALPRREALEALRDAGAFLLPSLFEGLPMAPLEAMQMGIPVVAANVSGLSEIIESGVSGILIDAYDPKRYAEAIRSLEAPDKRRQMIAEGRKTVAARFTYERTLAQHLELYEALAAGSSQMLATGLDNSGRPTSR